MRLPIRDGRSRPPYGSDEPSSPNAMPRITASRPNLCLVERQTADQILGLANVVHLARGQDEAKWIAERVHARADLRAQAAARTPNRFIFAPPFAPAACWCARTMVESMIKYSKSGLSSNALKRLSPKRLFWPTAESA
jgi:hypothetical protein